MKKVYLSVDLEDNEVFDEQVKEAIRGYARQMARAEMQKEIKSEIERLTKHAISEGLRAPTSRWDNGGSIYVKIRDAVNDAFKQHGNGNIGAYLRPIIREEVQHVEPSDLERAVKDAVDKEKEAILASVKEMMMNELLRIVASGLKVGDFVK